ncbi:MAG: hypothetical protein AAGJ87_17255 [Pseudomonadota bacterium]
MLLSTLNKPHIAGFNPREFRDPSQKAVIVAEVILPAARLEAIAAAIINLVTNDPEVKARKRFDLGARERALGAVRQQKFPDKDVQFVRRLIFSNGVYDLPIF